jgi:hypothetical protein
VREGRLARKRVDIGSEQTEGFSVWIAGPDGEYRKSFRPPPS